MTDSYLIAQLEAQGYKGRIIPIQHLLELQEEIKDHYRRGLFDEQFYQESLTSFDFSPPASLPEARSVMVIAVPRPQFQILFTWQGNPVPVFVPAYYLRWRETEKQLEDSLAQILAPYGQRAIQAALPAKLLAVRSGLGQYGKNNICYVPGMGSFLRLWTFYSDYPCQEDNWHEAQMMTRCQDCSACLRKCPTGAITSERFLLRAERCITFHNEQPGDVAFPDWLDPSWHNCLVGCSQCQNFCPENKKFRKWVDKVGEFTEQETARIMERIPLDQLPAPTMKKLARSDLSDYANLLPRNLSVLVNQQH